MKPAYSLLFLLIFPLSVHSQTFTSVPFDLVENLIFIQMSVNDSKPLNFMFDSGAGITVLNSSTARDMNLKYSGEATVSTSSNKVTSKSSIDNRLLIGALELKDIDIEVLDLDHLADYFKVSFDGIIGYDIFSKYLLLTNIDARTFTILDTFDFTRHPGWEKHTLLKIDNRKIGLEVDILTRSGSYSKQILTVDTGKPDEVNIFSHAPDDLALKISKKSSQGTSASPTITSNRRGRLKEIKIDDKIWKNVKVVLTTDPASIEAFHSSEAIGLLGQELLLNFNILYNYPKDAIYLQQRK